GLGDALTSLLACAPFNPHPATGLGNGLNTAKDPLPINTSTLLLDYPEDIRMFGVSFNTTAFGWSVSGEYSYRPNLPAQVLITDAFFAGYQQAFAQRDVTLGSSGLPPAVDSLLQGLGIQIPPTGLILPAAETFIPSFLTKYRGRTIENGNEYQPGEYV